MPPKKGGSGGAKPAKGAKSDDSGEKGEIYFKDVFIFQNMFPSR